MAFFQERIKKSYDSVLLPVVFQEEDRGFAKCCELLLVLAGAGADTETWKNDVTSAWLLLSDPADTFTFELFNDNGDVTVYVPTIEAFPNQANAFFTTIEWKDVLVSDGEGCYELKVVYNIGGLDGAFTWGQYKLEQYSIKNALETARIKCLFNMNQSIEGINFTGSNVEDHIRFNGQIRKDQSNMEINNLIYNDRKIKTVVNENLPTFLITTDPYTDEILRKFTDLYLLSANEMFISDYNAHTSSYRINDVAVTIKDSPEKALPDKYSRFEVLTCIVTKRVADDRTYY